VTATVAGLIAGSGLPLPEARALLAHRLGVARERLVAHPESIVGPADADAFAGLARRRALGEPLAYLLGEKEFYGRAFAVTPDVLVPRPETELLVDLALERMREIERPRVLDLGTGSGCIAVTLALECPGAQVTAIDASDAALAERLGAAVAFSSGDWYDALPAGATFDLIVSNPPYVAAGDPHLQDLRFEPMRALVGGPGGLACLQVIATGAGRRLAPRGWLLVEHGYDQGAAVAELFTRSGLIAEARADGAGHLRVTLGQPGPVDAWIGHGPGPGVDSP
jgi:release factor glutamine methyltransferase